MNIVREESTSTKTKTMGCLMLPIMMVGFVFAFIWYGLAAGFKWAENVIAGPE